MFNMVRRSFLAARSHPLLSHLNLGVHRHVSRGSSVVTLCDGPNLAMSRRYWSDWSDYEDWDDFRKTLTVKPDNNAEKKLTSRTHCGECGRTNRQRKHLYVVVDDWREGFSVHKLDVDDKGNMGTTSKSNSYLCLPSSRVRIAYSGIGAGARFTSMGSKIIACLEGEDGVTVIYDTATEGLAIVRQSPDALHYHWEEAVAVGDTLYTFVSKAASGSSSDSGSTSSVVRCSPGEIFCLDEVTDRPEDAFCFDDFDTDDSRVGKKCSWRMEPSPVPFYLCHGGIIRSYAVHPGPEGNRFYVSVTPAKHYVAYEGCHVDQIPAPTIAEEKAAKANAGTYTFHTKTREWTRLGTWMLPFASQGYYDPELDAWVGLDVGCHDGNCKTGSCNIPSRAWGSPEPPSWKLCEKDFSLLKSSAPPNINVNVLVAMGSGRFCLVQCMPRNGDYDSWGDGNKFGLHVTTFRARYGKNGDLTITDHRLVHSYVLSRYAEFENFSVQAFWM